MKSQAFLYYSDVPLTLIGLGLFVAVFVSWVFWVSIKENRVRHDQIAKNMLDEGERL